MTAYSLYLGCLVPTQFPYVERAVRDVLSSVGVETSEMIGASCCAPNRLFGVNEQTWLALNRRNFSLARGEILTVCDECFASLQDASLEIDGSGETLPPVKPFVAFLSENEKELGEKANELGLKCAIQHSCHLLRPSKVRKVDNPENPILMRNALDAIGCRSVKHDEELSCCGGQIVATSRVREVLAKRKISSAEGAGADCVVTTCAHCLLHLSDHSPRLPVVHLAQLYALALGSEPSAVGLTPELFERVARK